MSYTRLEPQLVEVIFDIKSSDLPIKNIVEFGLTWPIEKFANFFESHWYRFDLSLKSMSSLDNDAKFALWKSVAVYSWFDASLVLPLTGVRV